MTSPLNRPGFIDHIAGLGIRPTPKAERTAPNMQTERTRLELAGIKSFSMALCSLRDKARKRLFKSCQKQRRPKGPSSEVRKPSMGNYEGLCDFMGHWPDLNIFRRFGFLQAQNLLFLQAELAHLQLELGVIREDQSTDDEEHAEKQEKSRRDHAEYWLALLEEGEESDEYNKVVEIRDKLEQYSEYTWRWRLGNAL